MAVRRAVAPSGSGVSGGDRDAAIVVERVSKRYPTSRVSLFPPVASVFDRELNPFRRKSTATEAEAGATDEEASSTKDAARPRPRPRTQQVDYDLDDDEFDDEEEDDEFEEGGSGKRTPWQPGEMFWALREVSFRVPAGAALGVLGGPGSGKSTLLGILGGRLFPTEGRVLIRDPVAPLPSGLAKGLALTDKGTFDFELVLASRLLGLEPHLIKPHKAEIEAMASPLWTDEEEPAPGAMLRLGVATAVVVPTSVILLEESPSLDEAFMAQVVERIPERLRGGSSLVLASRSPELVARLCDEAIVLHEGSIIERGSAKDVVGRYGAGGGGGGARSTNGRSATGRAPEGIAPSRHLSDGRRLRVPPVVPAFNSSAALLSATLSTDTGRSKRIDAAADEVTVEIRFETAHPDIEAHCGVVLAPRGSDETGIRLELAEPLRFVDPRTYVLLARIPPGALPAGAYEVRADAIVANPAERGASVITRDMGRVRIVGDEEDLDTEELLEPAVVQWDGRATRRVDAEWSVEQERSSLSRPG